MFWFKVEGESFQTPTVIIMSEAKPIDWSLNELLFTTICQSLLTGRLIMDGHACRHRAS